MRGEIVYFKDALNLIYYSTYILSPYFSQKIYFLKTFKKHFESTKVNKHQILAVYLFTKKVL